MKTVKETGSSRSRSRRRKVVGMALGLAALGSVGGLVQASTAHAAQVGTVNVRVGSRQDQGNWGLGWSSAIRQCQAKYRQTRSVELIGRVAGIKPGAPSEYYQVWACRDTP